MLQTYRIAVQSYRDGCRTGLAGSFNADLSQSCERMRCGPWVPTLAKSTIMCSLSQRKLFTPAEVDLAMGWPSVPSHANAVYSKALGYDDMFKHASVLARQHLSGNGMMIPQIMAFYMYIASHTIRKDKLQALPMPVQSVLPDGWSEDDSDID